MFGFQYTSCWLLSASNRRHGRATNVWDYNYFVVCCPTTTLFVPWYLLTGDRLGPLSGNSWQNCKVLLVHLLAIKNCKVPTSIMTYFYLWFNTVHGNTIPLCDKWPRVYSDTVFDVRRRSYSQSYKQTLKPFWSIRIVVLLLVCPDGMIFLWMKTPQLWPLPIGDGNHWTIPSLLSKMSRHHCHYHHHFHIQCRFLNK